MQQAVSPAYMVPDTVKADTLFRNMRKERHGIAVILDEYGGTRGIVTINDLVEQLVGELGNNDVVEEEGYIELLEENTWRVVHLSMDRTYIEKKEDGACSPRRLQKSFRNA